MTAAAPDQRRTSSYRPDIDGLRGVAVVAVVWFHSGLPGMPGGFAGVDIFFVISGFLITSIIRADLAAARFSFRNFYERRFRRIAPALLTVVAASLAAGYVLLLPYELTELGKSAVSTVFLAPNIYFWRTANYFAFAHGIMPLLHSWSLGVEEQFYLLFPLLLVLAERVRKAPLAIAVTGVASFLLSLAALHFSRGDAFYLLPCRAWELMMGAAVAAGTISVPGRARHAASLVGAALIVATVALLSEHDPFPGWRALLPAVGTALIIASGRTSVVARGLSAAPIVQVGLVSYSFYLWHWPLLVFVRHWRADLQLPLAWALGTLLAAFMLAVASYRLIEQPARRREVRFRQVLIPSLAVAGAILAASAGAIVWNGLPQRLPARVDAIAAGHDFYVPAAHACMDVSIATALERCRIGPPGRPQYLLWGDSHAAAVAEAAGIAVRRPGVFLSIQACPPVLGWLGEGPNPVTCPAANLRALRLAEQSPEIRTIILSAFWGAAEAEGGADFWRGVQNVVDRLNAAGKQVFVVAGIPDPGVDVPWASAIRERFGRPPIMLSCLKPRVPLRGVTVIDVSSGFCGRPAALLFRDSNHPSRYAGVTIIAPRIAEALNRRD